VIVAADAFILSHCMERIDLLSNDEVRSFVGEHHFRYSLLDTDRPLTVGPLDLQDYYFEHKRSQIQGMLEAMPHIECTAQDFNDRFGRYYPIIEEYKTDNAEIVVLVMGSTAGTAKDCVDALRGQGKKVGLLKLRVFRPFPAPKLAQILSRFKVVGVMDRVDSLSGQGGPLCCEARAALYEASNRPIMVNYIYGLGGREVDISDIARVYKDLEGIGATGRYEELITYLGVREEGGNG
jgi:pyruvate ferredoxin oxidoreductase alpha subunit